MLNMVNKRKHFLSQFNIFIKNENVELLKEWGKIPFPEDTTLCNWYSDIKKRSMSVQEIEPEDTIIFSGFTGDSMYVDDEIVKLIILVRDSEKYVKDIYNIYKTWFYSEVTQIEMDEILNQYSIRLNAKK